MDEYIKKSLIMSSINNALRVPTLPIEIWFEIEGSYTWEVSGDRIRLRMKERKAHRFAGKKYLNALLEVATPEELGRFVDKFGCPIRKSRFSMLEYYPDPVPGSKPFPPYSVRLGEFFEVRNRLREAMVLPTSELLSRDEVNKYANPDTFDIRVERRKGRYYGTLIKHAQWESCYTVIVFERLLAGIKYELCEYCGRPFQITSKHKRKYCPLPATCGHAVAQQAYRGRKNN